MANQFKEKFNEYKKYVKENCKLYSGGGDSADDNSDSNSEKEDTEPNKEVESCELSEKLLDLNLSSENSCKNE